MQVEASVRRIRVARLALGNEKSPKASFDLNAELKEVKRTGTKFKLRYSLFLETFPAVQRAELEGDAEVESPIFSSFEDLGSLDQRLVTKLAVEIYRKSFEVIYLLFDSLGLDAPSPWILRGVQLFGK